MSRSQLLRSLQKKWYQKLKNSGFKDIEDAQGNITDGSGMLNYLGTGEVDYNQLNVGKNLKYPYSSLAWKRSQAEYYRLASQCLHDKAFRSKRHKKIWGLHANGMTYVEIGKRVGLSVTGVEWHVHSMRKAFGL
jgi:hypothetical protein